MEYGTFKLTDEAKKQLQQQGEAAAARGARANAAVETKKGNSAEAARWTAKADEIEQKITKNRGYTITGNEAIDVGNELRIRAGLAPSTDITPQWRTINDTNKAYTNYLDDLDKQEKQLQYQITKLKRKEQTAAEDTGDPDVVYDATHNDTIRTLNNQLDRIKAQKSFAAENQTVFNVSVRGDSKLFDEYRQAYYDYLNAESVQVRDEEENEIIKARRNNEEYAARQKMYAAQGRLKAKGYTDEDIQAYINVANTKENQEYVRSAQEWANKNILTQNLATAGSILTAPVRGILGAIGIALDPGTKNSPYSYLSNVAHGVQETVGEDIKTDIVRSVKRFLPDGKTADKAADYIGTAGSWVYQAAVSSLESALNMGLGGHLGEVLMGLDAATSTYNEALNNGLSADKALGSALAAGAFETIFEHMSMENIRAFKNAAASSNIFRSMASLMFTEGSEEFFTDIANEIYDYMANGGLSAYERFKEEYIKNNPKATEKDAQKAYAIQFGKQLGQSFIVGAMSGGMHGGAMIAGRGLNTAVNDVYTGKNVQALGGKTEGGVQEALSPLVSAVGTDSKLGASLTEISDKTGNRRTGKTVRKAYEQVTATQKKLMDEALAEDGMADKEARAALVDAYAEMMIGGNITKNTIDILEKYADRRSVLDEVTGTESMKELIELRRNIDLARVKVKKVKAQADAAPELTETQKTVREQETKNIAKNAEDTVTEHTTAELVKFGYEARDEAGHKVTAGAVDGIEDGKLQVVVDKDTGATASIDTLTFDAEDAGDYVMNKIQDMMNGAGDYSVKLSKDGANMMLALLENTDKDAETALTDYYTAYSKGAVLGSMDTYRMETGYDIANEAIDAMYTAGAANYAVKPGVTRVGSEKLSDKIVDELATVDAWAQKKGLCIVVTDQLYGELNKRSDSSRIDAVRMLGRQQGDVIVVALNSGSRENVLSLTAFHETFHWLGKQGKLGERYQQTLIDNIISYLKRSEDHDYDAIRQQRLDLGYSEDKVDEEIAAQYFGTILAEREFQKYAAEQDAPLWKRIIDHVKAFIEDIRNRIEQRFGSDRAVQAALMSDVEFIDRQVKAFDMMLDAVLKRKAKGEIEQTEEGTDYSFAGIGSKTADKTMLEQAEEMEEDGATSEEIRQTTGWFRGYDGKWRYEIDDSTARLKENPAFEIHETDKGEIYRTAYLKDLLENAEILSAYPSLGDYLIIIQDTLPGVMGETFHLHKQIVLNQTLFERYTKEYNDYLNGERKQEIARIEQTPEYREYSKYFDDEYTDKMDPETWLQEEKAAQDKFFSSELGKRYYQLQWGKVDMRKYEPGWSKEAKSVLFHELQHAVQRIEGFASGATTRNPNYERVAGEVEARDTGARADLTAEQRKETRPDIDRTDVVFADGTTDYSVEKFRSDWSIEIDENGKTVVVVTEDIFKNADGRSLADVIRKYIGEHFHNRITVHGQQIKINKDTNDEWRMSKEARALLKEKPDVYYDKLKSIANADEILLTARNWINEEKKDSNKKFVEYARGYVNIISGNQGYAADVIVGIQSNGSATLYDLTNIKATDTRLPRTENRSLRSARVSVDDESIAQEYSGSQEEDFSVDLDSDGRELTEAQQKYFADSKIRDADGRLIVMYHGSPNEFTVFDKKKSKYSNLYGRGFYFTSSAEHASTYGNKYKVYLNISDPLSPNMNKITKAQLKAFLNAVADNEDYDLYNYGQGKNVDQIADEIYTGDGFRDIQDVNATAIGDFVEAVELFNEVNGTHFDGIRTDTETVAFYPEQIKNVTNEAPTKDKDIRYSIDVDSAAEELTERIRMQDERAAETLDVMRDLVEKTVGVADKRLNRQAYAKLADKYLLTREGNDGKLKRAQVDEFVKKLERIDGLMTTAENVDSTIFYELYKMMREDVESAGQYETMDWVHEYRSYFRENGKKITIKIPQDVITDVVENYGGRQGFRKEVIGMFNVSYDENKGQDLDEFYEELGNKGFNLPTEKANGQAVTASDKVRNLIDLYRADDKIYNPQTKAIKADAEYAGMSLEEMSADKAFSLMTDILLQSREMTKNARQDAAYLKELRAQAGEENKEIQRQIQERMTQAYNNEMIRLRTQNLDSVQYEIEAEKIRLRYQLEGVKENYDRALAAIEDRNDILQAQRDEGVRQMRAEYEAKYEKQRERNAEQIKKQKEYYDQKLDDQWNKQKEYWKQKNDERAKYLRQMYEERLTKQRRKQEDTMQRMAEIRKAKRQMKAITDVFLNDKKNKYLPLELQKDILAFAQTFEGDRNMLTSNAMERLNNVANVMLGRSSKNVNVAYENMFGQFDDKVAETLQNMIEAVKEAEQKYKGRRNLTGLMTLKQLKDLNDVMTHVRFLIESANALYVDGHRRELNNIGVNIKETCDNQKKHNARLLRSKLYDATLVKMLTPIYLFDERIGGEFAKMYEDLRNGQDEWMWHVRDAYLALRKIQEEYGYDKWKDKKIQLHYEATGLRTAWDPKITIEAAMQIYATAKRQVLNGMESEHLNKGGIIISDDATVKKTYRQWAKEVKQDEKAGKLTAEEREESWAEYVNRQETAGRHQLTVGEMMQIEDILKEEAPQAIEYVNACVEFLSNTCSGWGNETSLQLTGLKKFNEKYYFPYRSASDYLHQRFGAGDDARLKNIGFTKSLQQGASTPLMITGFTQVFAEHSEQMARYAAFALRLDNFARVLNYQPMIETENGLEPTQNNIRTMIKNTYGAPVMNYISEFLTQMNGGPRADAIDSLINKFIGVFKRAAVLGNASVVIQQPTAMMRAMAMINPLYFTSFSPGELTRIKNDGVSLKALYRDYKDMMDHSAIANVKQMGGFDTDTGRSAVGWIMDEQTFMEKCSSYLGKGAEIADIVTWTNIWNAVKRETIHKQRDVEYGSDEYYKIVNERFRDIIDYTQVYDSTMSKNEWMRSTAGLPRMVTAFMAEPSLSFNLITQSGLKGHGKTINAPRAIAAFIANITVNAAFKAIVGAWRDKAEDETYEEKWIRRFTDDLFGNWKVNVKGHEVPLFFLNGSWSPLTMIPYVNSLLSIAEGFHVDRSDVSVISDIWDAGLEFVDSIKAEDGTLHMPDTKAMIEFASVLSEISPLPMQRIVQDIYGLSNMLFSGESYLSKLILPGRGYMNVTAQTAWRAFNKGLGFEMGDAEKAYNAVMNNDQETLKRLLHASDEKLEKIEGKGYTGEKIQKEADVDMEKKYISLLAEGLTEYDKEQRVQAAAQARADRNYDLYDELVEDMVNDGFSRNAVLTATETAWKALNAEEPEVQEIKDKAAYSYKDLQAVIEANDLKGYEHVAKEITKQGKAMSDVQEKARDIIYELIKTEDLTEAEVKRMLMTYGGLDEEAATKQAGYRTYVATAGEESAVDSANVWASYTSVQKNAHMSAQDAGIDAEVYAKYYKAANNVHGQDLDGDGKTDDDSVKKQILPIINEMVQKGEITPEQADELYLMRWTENNNKKNGISLKDAPWHK